MYIHKSKRIVIKIGSSILVDEKGKPKKLCLKEFAKDIKFLTKKNKQIVIVSSGAFGSPQILMRSGIGPAEE